MRIFPYAKTFNFFHSHFDECDGSFVFPLITMATCEDSERKRARKRRRKKGRVRQTNKKRNRKKTGEMERTKEQLFSVDKFNEKKRARKNCERESDNDIEHDMIACHFDNFVTNAHE